MWLSAEAHGKCYSDLEKDPDRSFSMMFLSFGTVTCRKMSRALMQTALKVHVAELVKTVEGQEFARIHCEQKNSLVVVSFSYIYKTVCCVG